MILDSVPLCSFWPKEKLIDRFDEIGQAAFDRGYRQKAVAPGDLTFPHFEACCHIGEMKQARYFFTGVDLSGRERAGNIISTIGIYDNGKKTIADIRSGKWSSPETAEQIEIVNSRWHPQVIHVENNAYQSAIIEWMREKGYTNTLPIQAFTTGKNKMDGTIGLPALDVQFEQGQWEIWLPEHKAGCMCAWCVMAREFRLHPTYSTSDSVMATWLAERAYATYGMNRATDFGGISDNLSLGGIARMNW